MNGRKSHYGLIYLVLYAYVATDFTFSRSNDVDAKRPEDLEEAEEENSLCTVIEQGINDALTDAKRLDPFYIGDMPKYRLRDGILKGLSRLESDIMDCSDKDNLVILKSEIEMTNAELLFHWQRWVLITFHGSITMKAKEVRLDLKVQLNTPERKFKVTDALLTKLKDFQFGFSGLGPLNPLAEGLMLLLYKIFRENITQLIEILVKADIEARLNKLPVF